VRLVLVLAVQRSQEREGVLPHAGFGDVIDQITMTKRGRPRFAKRNVAAANVTSVSRIK
jgi:hypothetical protein